MNIQLVNRDISNAKSIVSVKFLTTDELKKSKKAKLLNKAGFKASGDSICFLHNSSELFCGV